MHIIPARKIRGGEVFLPRAAPEKHGAGIVDCVCTVQFTVRVVGSGRRGYGYAITPLSLRDISPNRGISSPPTLALQFAHSVKHLYKPQFVELNIFAALTS